MAFRDAFASELFTCTNTLKENMKTHPYNPFECIKECIIENNCIHVFKMYSLKNEKNIHIGYILF